MTFADRWSESAPLRGLVGRLPADDMVRVASTAHLDFVAVDLATGPADEIAVWRLATAAHAAGLGVVGVTNGSTERLAVLGVDVVVRPSDPALRVVTRPEALGDSSGPVALDLEAVVTAAVASFARSDVVPTVPLVLLPGMLGSAGVFADVVVELGEDCSCRSQRVDLDESVSDAAESVLAAAPPTFALAGHSLGGIVALEVWRRAPHRVTALALLNSSARPPSQSQLDAWSELRRRTEAGEFAAVIAEQAVVNIGEQPSERSELVDRWIGFAGDVGPEGFLRQLSIQASRTDSREYLGAIDVPTLVVSGSADTVCPPEIQAELAAAIPGACHVTVDGAGHMALLDHPVEVAAALHRWLAASMTAPDDTR